MPAVPLDDDVQGSLAARMAGHHLHIRHSGHGQRRRFVGRAGVARLRHPCEAIPLAETDIVFRVRALQRQPVGLVGDAAHAVNGRDDLAYLSGSGIGCRAVGLALAPEQSRYRCPQTVRHPPW